LAAAAAAAFVLATCSGAASSSADTSAVKSTNGAPIKIGIISDVGAPGSDHPEAFAGAKAAASYLNAKGGFVGGHPVSIVTCNGQADPTATKACAQQFVSAGVIAVGGVGIEFPTLGLPVLQAAGIPFVGGAVAANDYIGPVSYPVFGGVAAGYPAIINYLVAKGIKSASIIYIDSAVAATAAQTFLVKPFAAAGVTAVAIPAPPSAADMTPAVEKALQTKPQAIFMLQDLNDGVRVAQSAAQLGYTGYFVPTSTGTPYVRGLTASQLKKSIVGLATNLASPNPNRTTFLAAMKKYQPRTVITDFSSDPFSEVMTLQTICKPLGSAGCTSSSVLAAAKMPNNVPVFLGKTLNVSTPVTLAGIATHAYNPWVRIATIAPNGSYRDATGKWIKG
jgi:branched-chain amino acid transport system substrate-binding protein